MNVRATSVAAALAWLFTLGAPAGEASAGCRSADRQLSALTAKQARTAIECLVNNKRRGIPNLRANGKLRWAASAHNNRMRRTGCFSHQCPGESGLLARIRRTGYLSGVTSYAYGEVIASTASSSDPRYLVGQYMGSPSHRKLLLDRGFEHLGVAVGVRGGETFNTIVLGQRTG